MARPVSRSQSKETAPQVLYTCLGNCGESKPLKDFYKSNNKLFKTKIVPYCKNCTKEMIYHGGKVPDEKCMKQYLELVNLPFLRDVWEKTLSGKSEPVGSYIRNIGFNIVTRDFTWKDSDFEKKKEEVTTSQKRKVKKSGIVSDELKKKWNTDNYEDVCFLEDEYDEWASNREVDDKAISDLVKEICYTKMELNSARCDKDNKLIGEKTKILQDLMGSANLKPVQDIGNASNDQVTFGTLIKKLENEEPIPEWETPDWVDELRIWTVGQLARMEGLKDNIVTDYVNKLEEYTISESEDEE